MSTTLNKTFIPQQKIIKYLGKDFDQFKSNLIDFAKNYYSKTYKDFNDSSPGMMYIDMASYVGDVLSFYIDYQFKEGMINYAEERKNVIQLARYLGYIPKPSKPSTGILDVYQIVPAKRNTDGTFEPDTYYALKIASQMQVLSQNGVSFIAKEAVDFFVNTDASPRVDEIYSKNDNDEPEFYLLKKSVQIYSGKIVTQTFNVSSQTGDLKLQLNGDNILQVLDVRDSDSNVWYRVDYLAQDLIEIPVENNQINFEAYSKYNSTVPAIIQFLRTNRRFAMTVDENNNTFLQFGSSLDTVDEEVVTPSSKMIGVGFSTINKYNFTLDPTTFVKSSAYGISPINTTLTVTYVVGGGIASNANVDSVTTVSSISIETLQNYLPSEISLINVIKSSIRVTNSTPCVGGEGQESVYKIKQNALANFATQNRVVTKEDYMSAVYGMPSAYGSIAKVYVSSETNLYTNNTTFIKGLLDENNNFVVDESEKNFRKTNLEGTNPLGVNLYVLAYDDSKNLTTINDALAYNLRTYLGKFRILSDRINIIDAYVINIGVSFKIVVYSNYNKKEVLTNCISSIQDFFNIDSWQIGQPINVSQLELEIAKNTGVQSIASLTINNLTIDNGDYSIFEYDINAATQNKIIYPPIDPAIFEIKNFSSDIKGSAI
jgi:hypothetical protein